MSHERRYGASPNGVAVGVLAGVVMSRLLPRILAIVRSNIPSHRRAEVIDLEQWRVGRCYGSPLSINAQERK